MTTLATVSERRPARRSAAGGWGLLTAVIGGMAVAAASRVTAPGGKGQS